MAGALRRRPRRASRRAAAAALPELPARRLGMLDPPPAERPPARHHRRHRPRRATPRPTIASSASLGIATMRDGLRWHLIERRPGRLRLLELDADAPGRGGRRRRGHLGPAPLRLAGRSRHLDPRLRRPLRRLRPAPPPAHFRETTDAVPFWCPVNEISFLAWAGGDAAYLNPFARGRGFELKVQLARAAHRGDARTARRRSPRALRPLRTADRDPPRSRHAAARAARPRAGTTPSTRPSTCCRDGCGRRSAAIRASSTSSGLNYYPTNQWIHGGPPIGAGHPLHRPLSDLLFEVYARFGRPIVIAETGTEGEGRASWLRTVAAEVRRARARGVPVEGHLPLSGRQPPRLGRRPALRERSPRTRGPRRNPGRACAVAAAGRRGTPSVRSASRSSQLREHAHAATVVRQASGRAEPQGRTWS